MGGVGAQTFDTPAGALVTEHGNDDRLQALAALDQGLVDHRHRHPPDQMTGQGIATGEA